ncbi:MAG: hypothetical protein JO308_07085, partial [Verrucomicrobia bacterium]|nr:hypothetical protein [Verrucomicrobiota bacterium]
MAVNLGTLQRFGSKVTRYYDVIMAVVVVLILALMIMPIPAELLDVLLASNLSISVLLLLLAM